MIDSVFVSAAPVFSDFALSLKSPSANSSFASIFSDTLFVDAFVVVDVDFDDDDDDAFTEFVSTPDFALDAVCAFSVVSDACAVSSSGSISVYVSPGTVTVTTSLTSTSTFFATYSLISCSVYVVKDSTDVPTAGADLVVYSLTDVELPPLPSFVVTVSLTV